MNSCFRCGAVISSDTAFCPECGAPQIRVQVKTETADAPAIAEQAHAPELPPNIVPDKLHWPQFFRGSWLLVLLTAIATALFMPAGFLLFLPGSVIAAVRIYARRYFGLLRTGQGAALGAGFGAVAFVLGTLPAIIYYSGHTGEYRAMLSKGMQDALARNPDPQVQKTLQAMLSSNESVLALTILVLLFMLVIWIIVGSVAGASTVALSKQKPRL